ncbi:glycosyltransferase [Candidatus Entotheonella serta]|nr:glycosyltransferase [Candidatus Entotheonella serta]
MAEQSVLGIELSIIVPILNERNNLQELQRQLTQVLTEVGRSYEIIYIDDGSTDGSQKLCREFVESNPHVMLVELRRHFGKAAALQAGFQTARGEIIITMDGDLQDDAKEIPAFLEALEDDLDLVSGWKRDRQDPISKTLPSRFFNYVTSQLTGIPLRDFNCGFKAYRREVVEHLDLYGELYRYIPVLAHAKGYRVGEIPVEHRPRIHGKSKYSIERFFRGAFDLVTVLFLRNYQRRPLHLFGLIGVLIFLTGFTVDAFLALQWFLGLSNLSNRPLLLFGTLLITVGVQVLIFGLLAEMITAATYRRSEVTQSIRQVYGRDAIEGM